MPPTRLAKIVALLSKIIFWTGVFSLVSYVIFPGTCICCTPFLTISTTCFALAILLVPLTWILLLAARWQSRKDASESRFRGRREAVRLLGGMALFAGYFFYVRYNARRGPGSRTVRRMITNNHMKQILLALENYAVTHGHYPPHYVTQNADGKPCHSWRVSILPFWEQKELFEKIRLDEPWDSPWNRQFHTQMPAMFQNPLREIVDDQEIPQGFTTFAVLTGPGTLFPHDGPGHAVIPQDAFSDEQAPLILVERKPVCWMDPAGDFSIEQFVDQIYGPEGIQPCSGFYMIGRCGMRVENVSEIELHKIPLTLPASP